MNKIIILSLVFVSASLTKAKCEEPYKGYKGHVDIVLGDAYNFNTAQTISTNNMQLYMMVSTTHGYEVNYWFVGVGVGYYHSFRDNENMFPIYAAGRYTFGNIKLNPYIETRAGVIYDPLWIRRVQAYGTLGAGMNVYKKLQIGLRLSIFSRPSRFFTANAAVVVSYAFGK